MKINQKGFSLTELMIALVLGLILLGGAISVFLSNQATGRSNNAISEIQNIARIGSLLMSYDIRNAGFSGCNNVRISNVIAVSGARPDWGDWEFGGGIKGLVPPVSAIDGVTPVAGSEALRVMYGSGTGWSISDYDGSTITLNEAPSIIAGDIVLACDENLGSIFQATAVIGNEVTHDLSGLNCDDDLGFVFSETWTCGGAEPRTFSNTAMLMGFQSVTWFVAPSSEDNQVNSLYRASLIGDQLISEEVLFGVVAIAFEYMDKDTMTYRTATDLTAAGSWDDVIAVRVTLEVDNAVLGGVEVPDSAKNITFLTSLRNRSQ